ncbi:MAG: amidohydrolase family protein [Gammaproteobacteria bacterium]|nr:amidohydrolase family protein [Gammaproteobacteria bacterium]
MPPERSPDQPTPLIDMTSEADFIVHAGWLFSAAPDAVAEESAAVAVKDRRIVAVGARPDIESTWHTHEVIELPDHLLLPGLVNAHTHSPMTLLRGVGNDMPLHEWLFELIFPLEAKWVSPEFVADGARLALAEMIRAGITCFSDQYYFPETIATVVSEAGVRAQIAVPIIEQANAWAKSSDEGLRRATELHDHWRGDECITIAHGPHAPYSVDIATFETLASISEEIQSPVHIHLHETAREVSDFRLIHGCSPIRKLRDIGLVSPRLQAVHMTTLDDADMDIVVENNVGVVHCPQSNALLASGLSPLVKLVEAGVRVGLGTDGAVSNNSLDVLQEMRAAKLLANKASGKNSMFSAADFVRLGTIGSASVLGRDDHIGSLETGKWADMIAIDMSSPGAQPVYDVLASALLTASASRVTHTWVGGSPLMRDGTLTTLNETEVLARAKAWGTKISEGIRA